MRRMLFAVLLCAATAAPAAELRRIPVFRQGIVADSVGVANLAAVDLNGDNVAEVISCSDGSPFAVGRRGSSYATVWHGPNVGCSAVTAGDRDGDGSREVIVVTSSGAGRQLLVLDPRSLGGPAAAIDLPGDLEFTDVAIGNVDFDSANEIVTVTTAATYVYDAATLELQWTASGYGGRKLAIGDLEGDGKREIVVNGDTASVLDAGNEVLKWGYVGGFGFTFAVGNVDADPAAEIVYAEPWSQEVTVLHGDTFDTQQVTGYDWGFDSVAIGDVDGQNGNEILTGDNQWGVVQGRSLAGAQLWSINNPEHGVQALAAGDLDGDGVAEVIWGAGISSSGDDALFIGDGVSKSIEWESVDLDAPFHSAVGDLDGDGRPEWIVASSGSHSGYEGGIGEVFDARTGVSKGLLDNTNQIDLEISHIAIGQLDADAALEIVALGTNWYEPTLVVWDGATRQIQFSTKTAYNSSGFLDVALLVMNIDADAVDEILLGASDDRVMVLNGASNVIQGSATLSAPIRALAAADLNGDASQELVVATTAGVVVLSTPALATLGQVALANVSAIGATSAGGGTVAAGNGLGLATYTGATLVPRWNTCAGLNYGNSFTALRFGTIGNDLVLAAGDVTGTLRTYDFTPSVCPEPAVTAIGARSSWSRIGGIALVDVTGDGRNELQIDASTTAEIALAGFSSEVRGDVTGDDAITSADIDSLVNYVFGAGTGLSPAGDANIDQRIGVEDAFQLIHHEFSGGPAPQP